MIENKGTPVVTPKAATVERLKKCRGGGSVVNSQQSQSRQAATRFEGVIFSAQVMGVQLSDERQCYPRSDPHEVITLTLRNIRRVSLHGNPIKMGISLDVCDAM
jgi:hypothetical protein